MTAIKAVQQGTNAELIVTANRLYPMDGLVLDLTPGDELGFWRDFKPEGLTLLPHGEDFRNTGLLCGHRDHVVFDPPYVTKGGHETSTIKAMNKRYGMLHVEKTPMLQWERQILPGLVEAHRLLKPKGLLWFKCMDYVTSGKIHWFTKMALDALDEIGFDLVDEFILDGKPGPQPLFDKCKPCGGTGTVEFTPVASAIHDEEGGCNACDGCGRVPRRQVHARRAHSVLMIARRRADTRRVRSTPCTTPATSSSSSAAPASSPSCSSPSGNDER